MREAGSGADAGTPEKRAPAKCVGDNAGGDYNTNGGVHMGREQPAQRDDGVFQQMRRVSWIAVIAIILLVLSACARRHPPATAPSPYWDGEYKHCYDCEEDYDADLEHCPECGR